ncbi:MAG: MotA/TolQ/ExbB proton channel family protein [Dehalococcoidia bacterium]
MEGPIHPCRLMLMIDGTDSRKAAHDHGDRAGGAGGRHEGGIAILQGRAASRRRLASSAVLGLISALSNLSDPSQLGHKIAVAFVASFYAVFIANLFFLPLAGKLKVRMKEEAHLGEMCVEGMLAIQAGENPRIVREKLTASCHRTARGAAAEENYRKAAPGDGRRHGERRGRRQRLRTTSAG